MHFSEHIHLAFSLPFPPLYLQSYYTFFFLFYSLICLFPHILLALFLLPLTQLNYWYTYPVQSTLVSVFQFSPHRCLTHHYTALWRQPVWSCKTDGAKSLGNLLCGYPSLPPRKIFSMPLPSPKRYWSLHRASACLHDLVPVVGKWSSLYFDHPPNPCLYLLGHAEWVDFCLFPQIRKKNSWLIVIFFFFFFSRVERVSHLRRTQFPRFNSVADTHSLVKCDEGHPQCNVCIPHALISTPIDLYFFTAMYTSRPYLRLSPSPSLSRWYPSDHGPHGRCQDKRPYRLGS